MIIWNGNMQVPNRNLAVDEEYLTIIGEETDCNTDGKFDEYKKFLSVKSPTIHEYEIVWEKMSTYIPAHKFSITSVFSRDKASQKRIATEFFVGQKVKLAYVQVGKRNVACGIADDGKLNEIITPYQSSRFIMKIVTSKNNYYVIANHNCINIKAESRDAKDKEVYCLHK